jgi:hypothetical protein
MAVFWALDLARKFALISPSPGFQASTELARVPTFMRPRVFNSEETVATPTAILTYRQNICALRTPAPAGFGWLLGVATNVKSFAAGATPLAFP